MYTNQKCSINGCVSGKGQIPRCLTHLIPAECLQVVQDLSDQGLTQFVDLCQKLWVPSIKCFIGVH